MQNGSLKRKADAKRFVEAKRLSEMLHIKAKRFSRTEYSFIPTQENLCFEVIHVLFICMNFCINRFDILSLNKIFVVVAIDVL